MRNIILLIGFSLLSGWVTAQEDKKENPFVVESLKDSECLEAVVDFEAYLFKTDLDKPNTSDFLYYGLDLKAVEKAFPYLIEKTEDGKRINYEMLVPILTEAIEETKELVEDEEEKRLKLQEEFTNYKITMENHLQQLYYQIEMLKSEMTGINESKSVNQ